MCEIFPEVESCCGVASVRVGMVLIAVLSITTGALSLGVLEQNTNFNVETMITVYQNVSNFTTPGEVKSNLANLMSASVTFVSFVFMFAGLALMFSTLSDQEGFAQMFVWLVFLNIIIGFVLVTIVCFECLYGNTGKCAFGSLDWLSAGLVCIAMVGYLLLWYYYCCVANSYVLNAYS